MQCKICKSDTQIITSKLILNKYTTNYHQCRTCHFIQTDEPFWLAESYNEAITKLDIGLINRNVYLQNKIPALIDTFFSNAQIMLDYGGGYGMFVRMMRDLGYDFFRQDKHCENIFANHFDITDSSTQKFDILTAFEVFEHLEHPMAEIEKMFEFSENIIFSTVLNPPTIQEFENWWYVSPLTGQHIAFYDQTTLTYIAKKFNKNVYTNGVNLHVFTSQKIDPALWARVFQEPKKTLLQRVADRLSPKQLPVKHRDSLLQKDYDVIEKKLISKN